MTGGYLKIKIWSYTANASFRLGRGLQLLLDGEHLSLFSEGFPTRFACENDSFETNTDFEISSDVAI